MTEHIEKTATGAMCRHCGGMVDDDGNSTQLYADGGEVTSDSGEFEMGPQFDRVEAEQREPVEDPHTEQNDRTEWMRKGAFADAIAGRGPVARVEREANGPPPSRDAVSMPDEEMMRKKKERYGFTGKRG